MSEKKSTFDRSSRTKEYDSVEMPSRVGDSNKKTINLPGFGEVERDKIQALKHGGTVSSASKRADGCAVKGKTRGRIV